MTLFIDLHHDRNRTLVSHGCEPSDNALLSRHHSIISRHQAQSPLRTRPMSILELLNRLLDTVGCRARDDRIVLEASLLKTGLDAAQHSMTISRVQVNRLSCAAEDNQTLDAVLGQEHSVGNLRVNVDGRRNEVKVGGLLGGEEGRDGHVDTLGRRRRHGEKEVKSMILITVNDSYERERKGSEGFITCKQLSSCSVTADASS